MANYVTITLDTTPPVLEIYAPSYTTSSIETEFRIVSNEPLSSFQNIYLLDAKNQRFDFTFLNAGNNEVIGKVYLNQMAMGIATLYVQLQDEVGNNSSIYTNSLNIIETSRRIKIEISDVQANSASLNDKVLANLYLNNKVLAILDAADQNLI